MKTRFHPVICLPPEYEIYDFTQGYDSNRKLVSRFGIGRYLEKRVGMYEAPLFEVGAAPPSVDGPDRKKVRDIHMGVDIGAPEGTSVHAFSDGEVFLFGVNAAIGDYGPTLITRHRYDGREIFALHGHLGLESIEQKTIGDRFQAGDVIGWVGSREVNGGWNPHLHFQLSWDAPRVPDMPGVVSDEDLAESMLLYPDPRIVLGPIY